MTSNQDVITATIRTAIPGAIGVGLAKLIAAVPAVASIITWINAQLAAAGFAGVTVEFLLTVGAVGLAIAAYYRAARWAGAKWPALEKWLVGAASIPTYSRPTK